METIAFSSGFEADLLEIFTVRVSFIKVESGPLLMVPSTTRKLFDAIIAGGSYIRLQLAVQVVIKTNKDNHFFMVSIALTKKLVKNTPKIK
jgi:hypothetical protein